MTNSRYLSSWAYWAQVGFVAAAYFGAARLGLLLDFEKTNASPVWPPSGIAFAAVLLWGYRVWPGILLGAFLANVVVFLANQSADFLTIVVASSCISIGNTLEALTGGLLLHRLVGARRPFDRAQDVFKFVAVALLMCVFSASIGPTSIAVAGMAPWSLFGTMWFTWWTGDTAGVLIVTPLLLAWSDEPRIRWAPRRLGEIALFVLLVLAGRIGFGEAHYLLGFIPILFLVWAAFRFGQRETVTATFLLSGIAIWDTLHGFGPFVTETPNTSLLLLQIFLGTVAVTAMVLAAVVSERRRAEEALRKLNQELEQRVIARTAQLEALNSELETFTYSASHDLRAPLRAMQGLSQALLEDYADKLDGDGKDYLQRVHAASESMDTMIRALLAYSHLSRAELRFQPVDLASVVADALDQAKGELQERMAEVTLEEPLPAVVGHHGTLVQVVVNLLSNAVKFVPPGVEPRVRVWAEEWGEWVRLWVEDNGIGVAREHHERIFRVFERLHGIETYPGTGIGLATVRKGVERMGGRAGLESEVGNGSRFWIQLPRGGAQR